MTHRGDSDYMTNEQYLEAKGNRCPACGSTDLYQNRDSVETVMGLVDHQAGNLVRSLRDIGCPARAYPTS